LLTFITTESSRPLNRSFAFEVRHLFEPDRDRRRAVAVDETKFDIEDEEVYVWAAVDVDTFEVLQVEVSPGRSSLDVLLFLTGVLTYCRGQSTVLADRGE